MDIWSVHVDTPPQLNQPIGSADKVHHGSEDRLKLSSASRCPKENRTLHVGVAESVQSADAKHVMSAVSVHAQDQ